jgi:hypothetical protein
MDRYSIILNKKPKADKEPVFNNPPPGPGQVWALIKRFAIRPNHWNSAGEMDHFMGTWVLLKPYTDPFSSYAYCTTSEFADRYYFKKTDIDSLYGYLDEGCKKSAEEYVGPACHYECTNSDNGCGVESGIGWICSRSPGHEGPHVACAGSGRHERHIWYMPGKDISTGEGPYR